MNTYVEPQSWVRDLRLEGSLCLSQLHDYDENDVYIEDNNG